MRNRTRRAGLRLVRAGLWLFLFLYTGVASAAVIVVDQAHPKATTQNPGTDEAPLLTIASAMQLAKPGDTVLVKEGVYRESIAVKRKRGAPGKELRILAAPGHAVIVSGADVIDKWTRTEGSEGVWQTPWKKGWGVDVPPADWPDNTKHPLLWRREAVFVDGMPLRQVLSAAALEPGTFFVSDSDGALFVRLPNGDNPAQHRMEVAVRGPLLIIDDCSYIAIEGLRFQHATGTVQSNEASAVRITQSQAVRVENSRFVWNSGVGISLANVRGFSMRNSVASFNGSTGFAAWKVSGVSVEDSETSYNNWRGALGGVFGWYAAGAKILHSQNVLLARHAAVNNLGKGIWFDTGQVGVSIDGAFLHGNMGAAVFFEAGAGPQFLTNSIVSSSRDSGEGVRIIETREVRLWHNTFVNSDVAVRVWGFPPIARQTWQQVEPGNTKASVVAPDIRHNIFYENGVALNIQADQATLAASRLVSDGNLFYSTRPGAVPVSLGSAWNESTRTWKHNRPLTLAAWRQMTGQDASSIEADPLFMNPAAHDWRLRANSPAAKAVLQAPGVHFDYVGTYRRQQSLGSFSGPEKVSLGALERFAGVLWAADEWKRRQPANYVSAAEVRLFGPELWQGRVAFDALWQAYQERPELH